MANGEITHGNAADGQPSLDPEQIISVGELHEGDEVEVAACPQMVPDGGFAAAWFINSTHAFFAQVSRCSSSKATTV